MDVVMPVLELAALGFGLLALITLVKIERLELEGEVGIHGEVSIERNL